MVYDFSSITPEALTSDIDILVRAGNLIREIIMVQNQCDISKTSEKAAEVAKTEKNMKLITLDSGGERVCLGRGRTEAIKMTKAPFLLFLQAGNVPITLKFLGGFIGQCRWTRSSW